MMLPNIGFKYEVRMTDFNLRPQFSELLRAGLHTAPPLFGDVMIVTSLCDGQHSQDPISGHYLGCAVDVRPHGYRKGGIRPDSFIDGEGLPEVRLTSLQNGMAEDWAYCWQRAYCGDATVIAELDKVHIHAQLNSR